jgi:hypothetical protein
VEPEEGFVRLLTQRSVSQFTFSSSDVWRGAGNPDRAVLFSMALFYCGFSEFFKEFLEQVRSLIS